MQGKFFMKLKWTCINTIITVCSIAALLFIGNGGCTHSNKTIQDNKATENNPSVKVFSQLSDTMIEISYSKLRVNFRGWVDLEIIGVAKGAVTKFMSQRICIESEVGYCDERPLKAELDEAEWRTFFNALHNNVKQWNREGYYNYRTLHSIPVDSDVWSIRIFTEDEDTLISSFAWNPDSQPPNWSEFRSVIHALLKTLKDKRGKLAETEYLKRFGTPMPDYQRSIKEIYYVREGQVSMVRLTPLGTIALYDTNLGVDWRFSDNMFILHGGDAIELNITDWFDLVNALGNDVIDLVENPTTDYIYINITERVKDCRRNRLENCDFRKFPNEFDPLAVSDEFKNVMDGIIAKIKKKMDVENE